MAAAQFDSSLIYELETSVSLSPAISATLRIAFTANHRSQLLFRDQVRAEEAIEKPSVSFVDGPVSLGISVGS